MVISENKRRFLFAAVFAALFAFILFLNFNTSYVWDDYVYKMRFDNGQHLTEFRQIFPSLKAHAEVYNGRLVAHFFAHLFLLLPKPVFNLANTLMYILMCFMMFRFAGGRIGSCFSVFLLLGIFSAVWLEAPCYGQVFLWLDGACNYLWGVCFNLVFVFPFYMLYTKDQHIRSGWLRALFLPFAFICGAFQENSAVAAIFMASLLIFLCIVRKKTKIEPFYYIAVLMAVLGLIFMATRPAEATKMTHFSLDGLLHSINSVYWSFRHMWRPYFAYVLLFCFSLMVRRDKEVLINSFVIFLGSLCANGIMILASFYPGRCAVPTAILILIADFILIHDLLKSKFRHFVSALLLIMLAISVWTGIDGTADIVDTNREIQLREQMILDSKSQGISDVQIPMLSSKTKYSPLYLELEEYITESPGGFANSYMASYYGVNSISGYYP